MIITLFSSKKKLHLFKRIFDLLLSISLILVTFPIFILIYFIYLIFYDGDFIYISKRVGRKLKVFNIFKFRTMVKNAENLGSEVTGLHDKRNLSIGRFLRATKIDELPQLFNILLGDMSFVGPRPNFKKLVNRYPVETKNILSELKPGLTDFSTLIFNDLDNYLKEKNYETKYYKKVEPIKIYLVKKYYEKKSFVVDLKIIFFTVLTIFKIINFKKRDLKYYFDV
jgi:lipopolysaccharide/colanic/teichoic acid biosynthesis glycosyltransferase